MSESTSKQKTEQPDSGLKTATERVQVAIESGASKLDLRGKISECEFPDLRLLAPRLTDLDLSMCPFLLSIAPLAQLTQLTHLNLILCVSLRSIAPLVNLTQLTNLYLDACSRLTSIAPLAKLTQLTEISLDGCEQITSIAPLAKLTCLSDLNLGGCTQLTSIETLTKLTRLTALRLGNCTRLTSIEPLTKIPQLTKLSLQGFTQLTSADLRSKLPQVIQRGLDRLAQRVSIEPLAQLTQLTWLCLRGCTQLTNIESLAHLTQLTYLDLSGCDQLTSIEPLAKLTSLKTLRLDRLPEKTIDSASSVIRQLLPQLEFLHLNHFEDAPREILSKGANDNCLSALRSYLQDGGAGMEPEQAVKLFLLGNGGTGKSFIAHRLAGLSLDGIESTHGVQILPAAMEVASYGSVAVQIWDFGGQDIYHGTHRLFLDKRAIFLVVWYPELDRHLQFEAEGITLRDYPLAYWADFVRSIQDENSAVLIIQSRCNLAAEEKGIPQPEGLSHVRTGRCAAKENKMYEVEGLLRGAIQGLLERDKIEIPLGWAGVRRAVVKLMEEDRVKPIGARLHRTMTAEKFKEICKENGCANADVVRNYLSATGTFFFREGLFRDQIILDQSWALDAIYVIFHRDKGSYREIKRDGGKFDVELLKRTVWEQTFSPFEANVLLSMMESCFICFRDPDAHYDGTTSYFAPDLMPERQEVANRIKAYWPDANADAPGFCAPYNFLHDGILRKILCKIGTRAGKAAVYWRYGCAFYDEKTGGRALIRCEKPDEASGAGTIIVQTHDDLQGVLLRLMREAVEDATFGSKPKFSSIGNAAERKTEGNLPGQSLFKVQLEIEESDRQAWVQKIDPKLPPEMKSSTNPAAFLSYARFDDRHDRGRLSELRELLSGEVQAQTGDPFEIFQDRNDIHWGQQWEKRLDEALGQVTFLIPILTPSYFKSTACREEFESFLRREKQLHRDDLILPIYYIECPILRDPAHLFAAEVVKRQYADWRSHRHTPLQEPAIRLEVEQLAKKIILALNRKIA